ncbi:sensor histidine kinase [Geobacter pickeringii]|uniref:histidine kinase n=1 Tax=Geobacter pickeringii TaxID=345632 RepID=A0A0B5BD07_9BACT|nr:ATP-binding protein [Geobacter pickeringii]AJE04608.1 hypothetical protein GPICK_15630 [Geobacter pickeringii]
MKALPLERLVAENGEWLAERALRYGRELGCIGDVPVGEEPWRRSADGLYHSLAQSLGGGASLPPFDCGIDYSRNPAFAFGAEEVRRCRAGGVTLRAFLSFMKCCRRSCLDLMQERGLSRVVMERCAHSLGRFFELVEWGFCFEWDRLTEKHNGAGPEETVGSTPEGACGADGALRLSEQFFHAAIDAFSAHVAILESSGVILAVNRAWRRFADENGFRGEGHGVGQNYLAVCDAVEGEEAAIAGAVSRGIRALAAGRCAEFHIEYTCHSPDEKRWFQVRATRVDGGMSDRLAVVHENITEVKRAEEEMRTFNRELERRVRQRTAELEQSNREMEEFCHAVSHDLRGHLARLEGFGRGLFEDCADVLDARSRFYVERICRIGIDLRRVVDALLELSRIGREELAVQEVDLGKLAGTIIEELHRNHPRRVVRFTVPLSIAARGDPRLLRIVLEKLLGNAWKFTSGKELAEIEFGVTQRYGMPAYFVRDNGAGFDMRYAGRLFRPFQRLHADGEFAGEGIGLATVQRVVRRHGGHVWAEGAVGEGAIFTFTLSA